MTTPDYTILPDPEPQPIALDLALDAIALTRSNREQDTLYRQRIDQRQRQATSFAGYRDGKAIVQPLSGQAYPVDAITNGSLRVGDGVMSRGGFVAGVPRVRQTDVEAIEPTITPPATGLDTRAKGFVQNLTLTLKGDYILKGIGTQDEGGGVFNVSEIPSGARVKLAVVYWALKLQAINEPYRASFNGARLRIGADRPYIPEEPAPPYDRSTVYRNSTLGFTAMSDVTAIVTGNGSYTLSGLPTDSTDASGTDAGRESSGAILLVIYEDESQPLTEITFFDGAIPNGGANIPISDQIQTCTPTLKNSPKIAIAICEGDPVGDITGEGDDGEHFFNGVGIGSDLFNSAQGAKMDVVEIDVSSIGITDTASIQLFAAEPLVWIFYLLRTRE